jgi:predicted N-acetyltransferase YhbS
VLIGDPEYYARFFDFDAAPANGWTLPGPFEHRRLLVRNPAGVPLPLGGLLGPGRTRFATQRRIA